MPVALSASHIALGSVRMEPVFMILAESAAVLACLAIDRGEAAQAGRAPSFRVGVAGSRQRPFSDNFSQERLMIAFVSSERAVERTTGRSVIVSGCHDPDEVPVIDFVDTHRTLGMAIRVGATVLAGATVVALFAAI